eukprot:CAMPEP_0195532606 /NCGR_PEP_ID=MMETSP0794_2-20130614/38590_1 /TAXON_ID=515487 /ORGANISM="Stephanopyxis turris, Strain CCMP 815" /LENGTH=79 /DNA_ID=CAMNT_0040664883 /DNA_START=95 /DNA_END=331 /DNA_ORIENTATION=+
MSNAMKVMNMFRIDEGFPGGGVSQTKRLVQPEQKGEFYAGDSYLILSSCNESSDIMATLWVGRKSLCFNTEKDPYDANA